MPSLWAASLLAFTVFRGSRADLPTITDVLSTTANLSSLNTLLTNQFPAVLKQLEAYDGSNSITFVAPSNEAFENTVYSTIIGPAFANNDTAAIQDILNYQMIPGNHSSASYNGTFQFLPTLLTNSSVTGGQRVGAVLQGSVPPVIVFVSGESARSVVTQQDIAFTGGVIHVVDTFFSPPQSWTDTAEAYDQADEEQGITSFVGATYSLPGEVIPTYLNNTHNITIFIPNNIAMERVQGALSSMSSSALESILAYHIFTSTEPIYSSNLTNGTIFSSPDGQDLEILFIDNSFFVNSARILQSDLLINNGVMHVIDNVLDVNATTAVPNPTSATQIPVLPTTGTSFNSSDAPYTTFLPDVVPTSTALTSSYDLASSTSYSGNSPTETKKSSAATNYDRNCDALITIPLLAAGLLFGIMKML